LKNESDIYNKEWMTGKALPAHIEQARFMVDSIVDLFHPKTVIDIGCGPCNHLNEFNNVGVEVYGIDASEHSKDFAYDPKNIRIANLKNNIGCQPAELAFCLEVIEHIDAEFEDVAIDNILDIAGKWLIFSGAVPNQGGNNHVNEKPHQYWIDKIESKGLTFKKSMTENLRKSWKESNVQWWYWKNVMVFERIEK